MKKFFFTLMIMLTFLPLTHAKIEKAIFAGGCFWCMEPPFDKTPGVISTVSGYTGGKTKNPSYNQVSSGQTGHFEAIEVTYDSDKVSYKDLLKVFWKNIDPYDSQGQFCDKGQQYTSAVFYSSDEEKKLALETRNNLPKAQDIKTEILQATTFYKAEDYHQDYYTKNPIRYKFYRSQCGRDKRLEELWGDL